jgi:membrane-associated phospholipid phosphatase
LQDFWTFVTDFGDSAVTLPLGALTLIFLLASGWRRAAFAFVLAIGCAGLAIGLLKLLLVSCGKPLVGAALTDPSGHVAMSAATYGSLALALGHTVSIRQRPWLLAAAALLVAGIALSRILLHAHSPAEVAVGLAVGLLSALVFRAVLGPSEAPPLRLLWFTLGAIIIAGVMHGTRWPIEQWIKAVAHLIRNRWPGCG